MLRTSVGTRVGASFGAVVDFGMVVKVVGGWDRPCVEVRVTGSGVIMVIPIV